MQNLTFDKKELILTVKKNHTKHVSTFEKALDQYQKRMIKFLKSKLSEAEKEIRGFQVNVNLYPPVDYSSDYNKIIKMLEMSEEEQIELTEKEFDQYVMDNMRGHQFGTHTYRSLAFESPGVFSREIDSSKTFFSNSI